MLPGDVKARKAKAEKRQQTIDAHLTEHKVAEQVVPYSDKLFKKAAIEWLVATDQVWAAQLSFVLCGCQFCSLAHSGS
jgi:hypothetical protein